MRMYIDESDVGPFRDLYEQFQSREWVKEMAMRALTVLPIEQRKRIWEVALVYHFNSGNIEYCFHSDSIPKSVPECYSLGTDGRTDPVFIKGFILDSFTKEWMYMIEDKFNY